MEIFCEVESFSLQIMWTKCPKNFSVICIPGIHQVDWNGIEISNIGSCVSRYLAFLYIFWSVCEWTNCLISRPGHLTFFGVQINYLLIMVFGYCENV